MAVILMDGFDTYNGTGANTGLSSKWTLTSTANLSMTTGRFGGQGVQTVSNTGNTHVFKKTASSSSSSVTVGFACKVSTNPSSGTAPLMHVLNGTTTQCGIGVTTTMALTAERFSSTTSRTNLGTSAANVLVNGNWHYIEVEMVINDSTGSIIIYVDGASVLTVTGADTKNDASVSTCDTLSFGHVGIGTGYGIFVIDDVYMTDSASKLGERRVETLYPTSDVAQGFARSTGSTNYTLVDEAQVNGDTDYVQGSNVGDVDTYGFGDLSSTPTTIDAVQLNAFALKTDAGTRTIYLQAKSGATTSDGSAYGLNASYSKFERLLLTDPNTSTAWTASGVNALQGGPKVAS